MSCGEHFGLNNCCFTQTVFCVFDAVKFCMLYGIHIAMRLAHGIFLLEYHEARP